MPNNSDSLMSLVAAIAGGTETKDDKMLEAIKGVFGERFHKRSATNLDHTKPPFIRNAYGRGGETDHVAYAGFINPENASSGPYGGMSLVWFPSEEGCLIAFGVGTRGLSPDRSSIRIPSSDAATMGWSVDFGANFVGTNLS